MSLLRPAGFVLQHGAVGFQDRRTRAALMASEWNKPSAVLLKEMESGQGQWSGLKPDPQEHRFGDYPGRVFTRDSVDRDDPVTELTAVFGNDTASVVVTAITTQSMGDEIKTAMRQAVLSVRWDPQASLLDSLPFSVTMPSTVGLIGIKPDSLGFAPGLRARAEDGAPRLLVRYDGPTPTVAEREAWMQTLYGPKSGEHQLGLDHFEQLKIDGRSACEVVRTRQVGRVTLVLYTAEVFDSNRTFKFVGSCLPDDREKHIPDFQKTFRSLRIKEGQ